MSQSLGMGLGDMMGEQCQGCGLGLDGCIPVLAGPGLASVAQMSLWQL